MIAQAPATSAEVPAHVGADAPAPPPRPDHRLGALVAAASIAGSALNSFLDDGGRPYHFTSEGWFGRSTDLGGADKAAHFVDYYIISRELTFLYA